MAGITEDKDQTVPEVAAAPLARPPSGGGGIEPLYLVGGEAVDNLSRGFLAVLEPELLSVHTSLEELVYV